jgi:hypothetical protein
LIDGVSNFISEDVLRSISVALKAHAPHLIPSFNEIMRGGIVTPPSMASGASVHATLTGSVPMLEGEAILKALEAIEKKHGYNAIFEKRQINWLVLCWRQFSAPKQIPPQPEASTSI